MYALEGLDVSSPCLGQGVLEDMPYNQMVTAEVGLPDEFNVVPM